MKKIAVILLLPLFLNIASASDMAEIVTSSLTYAYGDDITLFSSLKREVSVGDSIDDLFINVEKNSFADNVNYLYSQLITTKAVYKDGIVEKTTSMASTSTYSDEPFSAVHNLSTINGVNSTDFKIEDVMEKSGQRHIYNFANTFANNNVSLSPIFEPKYAYYDGVVTFATGTSKSVEANGAKYSGGITLETVVR